MQFLKQLTDPALKRLYKFVLKRIIGRFLADEDLDLDQLDVHLRAGQIELCDLVLNTQVLNDELCRELDLPFRVQKGYLGSVKATISYTSLMSESCLVELDDIELVLVPIDANHGACESFAASHKATTTKGSSSQSHRATSVATTTANDSDARTQAAAVELAKAKKPPNHAPSQKRKHDVVDEISQEGLDFVAGWIEQVTSKIKVTVTNVCVRFEANIYDRFERKHSEAALVFRLDWLQFMDESSNDLLQASETTSVGASASYFGSNSAFASMAASQLFGVTRKGVKFRGVSVELVVQEGADDHEMVPQTAPIHHVLVLSDSARQNYVQLQLCHFESLDAPAVDADLFIHSIRMVLHPQLFVDLGSLVDVFLSAHTKQHMRTASSQFDYDRSHSTAMYQSICDQRPSWLDDQPDHETMSFQGSSAGVNLSYKEFQRIESLLAQYRKTYEEMRMNASNSHIAGEAMNARSPPQQPIRSRDLSAESVEIDGLSDLEEDEDFFDCDTGPDNLAMSQSIYASAMYATAPGQDDSEEDEPAPYHSSFAPSRSKHIPLHRQLKNRFKFHLLEFELVLLYEDLVHEGRDQDDDEEEKQTERGAHIKVQLPSVKGLERLELSCKDILFSCLVYPSSMNAKLSIGSLSVDERIVPRLSMDVTEEESTLLSASVLRFVDYSPSTGKKVHLSACLSCQMRIEFAKPSAQQHHLQHDGTTTSKQATSVVVSIQTQPILFEFDMSIVDRAVRLLKLLEADEEMAESSPIATKQPPWGVSGKPQTVVEQLDLFCECVQISLRFPMVNSDVIRFGKSSTRGLCEDQLMVTIENVHALSTTSPVDCASIFDHQHVPRSALPWLGEFYVDFDSAKLVLRMPKGGNQRSETMEESVLLEASSLLASAIEDKCRLLLRMQQPTRQDLRLAQSCKNDLAQDTREGVQEIASFDTVDAHEDDATRVGALNGWKLDAVTRAQRFEEACSNGSQIVLGMSVPFAKVFFRKVPYERLMILLDALLLINPIDVEQHKKALAKQPFVASMMSLKMKIDQGTIEMLDEVPTKNDPAQKHGMEPRQTETADTKGDQDAAKPAKSSFTFCLHHVEVFQVAQWMGDLVSRMHLSCGNITMFEEMPHKTIPVFYQTPYGLAGERVAPLVFVGIDVVDQTQEMRETCVDLHLSHLTLRYDVTSKWMIQLSEMLLMVYPPCIVPLDPAGSDITAEEAETAIASVRNGSIQVVKLAVPVKSVFTKLSLNLYDSLVDYAPSIEAGAILVVGKISVASNVVTGATMQGYKFQLQDIAVYLTNEERNYNDVDACLFGRDLVSSFVVPARTRKSSASLGSKFTCLMDFLESSDFLQIATLDFIDVFLRAQVETAEVIENQTEEETSPSVGISRLDSASTHSSIVSGGEIKKNESYAPQLSVELNLGTINLYVCFDSFSTLVEIGNFWSSQLAKEVQPKNTKAYVGLDRVRDVGSVSVVTNLSSTTGATPFSLNAPAAGSSVSSSSTHSSSFTGARTQQQSEKKQHAAPTQELNIMHEIDANAFRTTRVQMATSDTEARLFQTRLLEVEKHKKRVIDESKITRSVLIETGSEVEAKVSSKPRVRINELMIEDYYATEQQASEVFAGDKEPSQDAMPWFTSDSTSTASPFASPFAPDIQPPLSAQSAMTRAPDAAHLSKRGDLDKVLHPLRSFPQEQVARWIAPSTDDGITEDTLSTSGVFEPVIDDRDEEDELEDKAQRPFGAFPAIGANNWGFNHAESKNKSAQEGEEDNDAPNAMSMSLFGAGDDEGTEVTLDFELNPDLQNELDRLLGFGGSQDVSTGDDDDDEEDDEEDKAPVSHAGLHPPPVRHVHSSPMPIPSVIETHQELPSPKSPEEPVATWYDEVNEIGQRQKIPLQIIPHHVEIPIGGDAATLSFGEKETKQAIRSVMQEQNQKREDTTAPFTAQAIPIVVTNVLLRNLNLRVRFFGGHDWEKKSSTSNASSAGHDTTKSVRFRSSPSSSSRSPPQKAKLLNALLDDYVPTGGHDPGDEPPATSLFAGAQSAPEHKSSFGLFEKDEFAGSGRRFVRRRSQTSGRKTEEMLELMVSRIQMRLDVYNEADNQALASNVVLALGEIELLDYISTSQIRKIICYWKSESLHPRETGSSMVNVHLVTVRPGPNLCEEHRLRVRILPLRINLDQEVVLFLKQFVPVEEPTSGPPGRGPTSFRTHRGQVEQPSNDDDPEEKPPEDGQELPAWNAESSVQQTEVDLGNWFFQSVDVRPCKIKIDYRPNRVDFGALRSGDYLEVINLFVLEGMELVLRHVKMNGVDGWAALVEAVLMSYVNDISRHQIHKCIASVSMPPLRSVANIGSGAADLILLPMEHYNKDRRIVRGFKKGAKSFLKSVTIETLNTASKVARGTQAILETADDLVLAGGNDRYQQKRKTQSASRIKRNSRRFGGGGIRNTVTKGGLSSREYLNQQPSNAAEGLYQAYDSLSRELHVAAKTIVAVPLVEYKKTGSQGYVRSVIRAVPVAVLRPMIGATEAMSKALIGVRNTVDPELKEDIDNKFKDFKNAI